MEAVKTVLHQVALFAGVSAVLLLAGWTDTGRIDGWVLVGLGAAAGMFLLSLTAVVDTAVRRRRSRCE